MNAIQLRDYQARSLDALRDGIRAGLNRQLLMAATGAGKTVCAAQLMESASSKKRRAVFLVDRVSLVDQTSRVFDEYGIAHGVIQANHWRYRPYEYIQVASVQTLSRRGFPEDIDLLVIDEAHTIHKSTINYVLGNPDLRVVGLSATPFTKGLGKVFQNLVNVTTTNRLVEEGFLAPVRYYVAKEIDMTGAKTVAGEWADSEVESRGIRIVGDIVATWVEKTRQHFGRPVKTIAFGATVAHCEEIAAAFQQAGYNFRVVSYRDGNDDGRRALIEEFRKPDSDIIGLISCDALAKGFDCLDTETEILTPNGWKGIGAVTQGDRIYGYDRSTGRIEECECEGYGERPLRPGERMVTVKSQRFNIRTTEGHQFHIKYRDPKRGFNHQGWLTKTGAEMTCRRSAWGLPLSGFADFPGVPLSDDELRLIAWFMTDGGFVRSGLSICQSKPFKEEIRDLLVRLGLDFRERIKQPNGFAGTKSAIEFEIPKGTHSGVLARNGWAKYERYLDKNVAPALMQMTREQFRVFWEELLKGDGTRQGKRAGWLWCDRKEQADAYTQLAVLRGFSASYSEQVTKAGKTMYVVSVRDAQWIATSASALAAKFNFEDPRSDELVWCVKNRLSTLIVRRRGKIAVIGNCPDVLCGIGARPLRKSLSTHIQQIGRVMRIHPDKEYAIWLDHAGNVLRFHEDMEDVFQNGLSGFDSKNLDQRVRKEPTARERELRTCPRCKQYMPPKQYTCLSCGFEMPRKQSGIENVAGEMVELHTKTKGKARHGWMADKDSAWRMIIGEALIRKAPDYLGFGKASPDDIKKAEKFALAQYRSIYGEWPYRAMRNVEPIMPTPEVRKYIKSRCIAFSLRRAA